MIHFVRRQLPAYRMDVPRLVNGSAHRRLRTRPERFQRERTLLASPEARALRQLQPWPPALHACRYSGHDHRHPPGTPVTDSQDRSSIVSCYLTINGFRRSGSVPVWSGHSPTELLSHINEDAPRAAAVALRRSGSSSPIAALVLLSDRLLAVDTILIRLAPPAAPGAGRSQRRRPPKPA